MSVRKYLEQQLQSWSRIGTPESGLFATYKSSANRCDVYDNSLLVNALTMLADPQAEPPAAAVMILNFALGAVTYLQERKRPDELLVAAAYMQNIERGQPDLCSDVSCGVQDVGNNSMLCIAIAKFVRRFPQFEQTPRYKDMLVYLVNNIASLFRSCPDFAGYSGRVNKEQRYISTEHMIDVCGLCHVTEGLIEDKLRQEMLQNASRFVAHTYYEKGTDFGATTGCDLNKTDVQPVDTTTWNVLAGADTDQTRLRKAMETVCRAFVVTSSSAPGIKFTVNSTCAQYENTGAFLIAVMLFNPPLVQSVTGSMYDFVDKLIRQNAAFPGGLPSPCQTGLGWAYYGDGHLAATVYCALAALRDPAANPYGLGEIRQPGGEQPAPTPTKPPVLWWPWVLCALGFFLALLFLGLWLRGRK